MSTPENTQPYSLSDNMEMPRYESAVPLEKIKTVLNDALFLREQLLNEHITDRDYEIFHANLKGLCHVLDIVAPITSEADDERPQLWFFWTTTPLQAEIEARQQENRPIGFYKPDSNKDI